MVISMAPKPETISSTPFPRASVDGRNSGSPKNGNTDNLLKTESPPFKVELVNCRTIRFLGVYRGVDYDKNVYLLMAKHHKRQFNELAAEFDSGRSNRKRKKRPTYFCNENGPDQTFISKRLDIKKKQTGWSVKGQLIPYNSVCVFRFDFRVNRIVSMLPAKMSGIINNVMNDGNNIWVTSSLRVRAMEHRDEMTKSSGKCGRIASIEMRDFRTGMYNVNAPDSYMVHDWHQCIGKRGDRVTFCMKLSTKSNQKLSGAVRPVHVQAWNVSRSNPDKVE